MYGHSKKCGVSHGSNRSRSKPFCTSVKSSKKRARNNLVRSRKYFRIRFNSSFLVFVTEGDLRGQENGGLG